MTTIAVHEFVSLDGVFEDPSWTAPYGFTERMSEAMASITGRCTGLLLGHKTYEMFAPGWRDRTVADDPGAPFFNDSEKFVVASTPLREDWANTTVIHGYDPASIEALKAGQEGALFVSGSGQLVRALLADGLIDELHLFVYPVVRGTGDRLWRDQPVNLRLLSQDTFENGVVHLTYGRPSSN